VDPWSHTFRYIIVERKQMFEFLFAFMPTAAWIHALPQPANIAGAIFGIYRSAVGPPIGLRRTLGKAEVQRSRVPQRRFRNVTFQ
jgi:hypothetical protein